MSNSQVQNQSQHNEYVGIPQSLSQPHSERSESRLQEIDVDSPICVGALPGIHILGFFSLVLKTHRALLIDNVYSKIKTAADRVTFAEAMLLADSVATLNLDIESPDKWPLNSSLPHHVCMPGLAHLKTYEFGDALAAIALELYKHFSPIAAIARTLPDRYEAAQLAQCLHFAQCVYQQSGAGDHWDHPAEAFLIEQFARWSDRWASDPTGETIDCRLRFFNRGKTLAQVSAETAPANRSKGGYFNKGRK